MSHSFVTRTRVFLSILHVILLAIVAVYVLSAWSTAREQMKISTANLLQVYGNTLNQKINGANQLLQRIMFNNASYDQLQSSDEATRVYAALSLKKFISDSLLFDTDVDMVVVAESQYGTCLDQENSTTSLFQREILRDFTMQCAREKKVNSRWCTGFFDGQPYIYRVHSWNGYATALFMQLDRFMGSFAAESEFDDVSLYLSDFEQTVVWGELPDRGVIDTQVFPLDEGRFSLTACCRVGRVIAQIRSHVLILLALMILNIVISFWFGRQLRYDVLNPMIDMQYSMKQIVSGDVHHRITTGYGSREFTLLKDTFNSLMDQIVGLKIAGYEHQLLLQESELKAVRLQIKPHFFLNALTTISSLSQQGKNELIVTYIAALSKNIRYMFRSGLHTVTLQDEITHVENYLEMQNLKYPDCVFHFIDMDAEVMDWKIPQMLIHTIIENEYKYALSPESVLTILIRAKQTQIEGISYLLLEIEDDGEGYPESVLSTFNSQHSPADGQRLGLWSIRRMLELMYEKENLFTISNNAVRGCMNRFLIPKEPCHENAREDKWDLSV